VYTFIAALIVFFSLPLQAQEWVPLYLGSAEIQRKVSIEPDHIIALSKNKKVNGAWRFENVKHVQGVLVKSLYEIASENSFSDVAEFYKQYFAKDRVDMLYHCHGRACGSSNQWANGTFKESRLYGADDNQYYWVFQYQQHMVVMYLVQRGNDRIYLYLEDIQSQDVATLQSVAIHDSCQNLLSSNALRDFGSDKNYDYFLFIQLPGINTMAESQSKADACLAGLQNKNHASAIRALGLGEVDRITKRRVDSISVELLKIKPLK